MWSRGHRLRRYQTRFGSQPVLGHATQMTCFGSFSEVTPEQCGTAIEMKTAVEVFVTGRHGAELLGGWEQGSRRSASVTGCLLRSAELEPVIDRPTIFRDQAAMRR